MGRRCRPMLLTLKRAQPLPAAAWKGNGKALCLNYMNLTEHPFLYKNVVKQLHMAKVGAILLTPLLQ